MRHLPASKAFALTLVSAVALVLAISACGDDDAGPAAPTGPTQTPNESNNLGLRQCDVLTAAEVSDIIGKAVTAAPYAENHGDTALCRYSADGRFVAFLKLDQRRDQALPSLTPDVTIEGLGEVAVWINFVSTLYIVDRDWIVNIGFEDEGAQNRDQAVELAQLALPRLP